jgi:GNAT superfamily N-acetyltransferase
VMERPRISRVKREEFDELLPLLQGYLDFYEVAPPEPDIRALFEALLADPEREGIQLLARDAEGVAIGFATVFWSWSTTRACRIGTMNDLFVAPEARGSGAAEALIEGCLRESRAHGARVLEWMTAKDNLRGQAVYDRVGGQRSEWVSYELEVS